MKQHNFCMVVALGSFVVLLALATAKAEQQQRQQQQRSYCGRHCRCSLRNWTRRYRQDILARYPRNNAVDDSSWLAGQTQGSATLVHGIRHPLPSLLVQPQTKTTTTTTTSSSSSICFCCCCRQEIPRGGGGGGGNDGGAISVVAKLFKNILTKHPLLILLLVADTYCRVQNNVLAHPRLVQATIQVLVMAYMFFMFLQWQIQQQQQQQEQH